MSLFRLKFTMITGQEILGPQHDNPDYLFSPFDFRGAVMMDPKNTFAAMVTCSNVYDFSRRWAGVPHFINLMNVATIEIVETDLP